MTNKKRTSPKVILYNKNKNDRIYVVPYFKTVNTHLLPLAPSYSSSSSSLYTKKISLSRYPLSPRTTPSSPPPSYYLYTESSASSPGSYPPLPPASSPPSPPSSLVRTPPPSRSAAAPAPPCRPRTSSPDRYPPSKIRRKNSALDKSFIDSFIVIARPPPPSSPKPTPPPRPSPPHTGSTPPPPRSPRSSLSLIHI